jgi:hypothetical protein
MAVLTRPAMASRVENEDRRTACSKEDCFYWNAVMMLRASVFLARSVSTVTMAKNVFLSVKPYEA